MEGRYLVKTRRLHSVEYSKLEDAPKHVSYQSSISRDHLWASLLTEVWYRSKSRAVNITRITTARHGWSSSLCRLIIRIRVLRLKKMRRMRLLLKVRVMICTKSLVSKRFVVVVYENHGNHDLRIVHLLDSILDDLFLRDNGLKSSENHLIVRVHQLVHTWRFETTDRFHPHILIVDNVVGLCRSLQALNRTPSRDLRSRHRDTWWRSLGKRRDESLDRAFAISSALHWYAPGVLYRFTWIWPG